MNKLAALLLSFILMTGLFACEKSVTDPFGQIGGSEDTKGNQSDGSFSSWSNGRYDPPITLTRVMRYNISSTTFREGEDWDNNVFTEWLKDTLGIQVKTLWVVTEENDSFPKKLRISISRGEAMPDIISYRGSYEVLGELIESGRFMPIDDLFEQYAGELWKSLAEEYPDMWNSVTRDGKRYALPIFDYSMNTEPVLWIREDWMEKFQLSPPQTIEDLENIMELFVNGDPDGNGLDDTYGLAVTLRSSLNTWMTDLSWLFGAYGAINSQWNMVDGRLEYGSIHPGTKTALGKLNQWMNKGYISRDASAWDEIRASEIFTSGKAGIIAGPHWMPDWPLPLLKQNVPGASYKAYPVPVGPDGQRRVRAGGPEPVNGMILINRDCEYPEAFFHYYNFMLENFADPVVGSPFEHGFAEGYDYFLENGEVIKGGEEYINPLDYSLSFEGARIPDLMIKTLVKLAKEEPVTPYEKQVAARRVQEEIEAASIVMQYDEEGSRYFNWYEGRYAGEIKQRSELLFQMEREAFMKLIYGQLPLEAFDDFVTQWKRSGGDLMTAEVNLDFWSNSN